MPMLHQRNLQTSHNIHNSTSNLLGYGTSTIVTMDKNASLPFFVIWAVFITIQVHRYRNRNCNLESVLHANKQKVTATESMLRGLDSEIFQSGSRSTGPALIL